MDFSNLPENLLNSKQSKTKQIIYDFNERIKKLEIYLEENTPNFQAVQTFEDLKLKIKNLDDEWRRTNSCLYFISICNE